MKKTKDKSAKPRKSVDVRALKLFLGHLRPALSSLDGGDPDAAGEYLVTASAFCPSLAMRKQLEKVQDECAHGSLERAETILEQLVSYAAMMLPDSELAKPPVLTASKPQHTPGEWKAVGRRIEHSELNGFSGKYRIADAYANTSLANCPTYEEAEANARLIAAAPDLLAALVATMNCLAEYRQTGHMTGWDKPLAEAREALAKARAV